MDSDDEAPALILHEDISNDKESKPKQAIKVPLTIITGFLGSGKSTFLKYVLTEKHGYRIAIIMNEFGDTADIEGRAISVSSPDEPASLATEFLELANGCLCCSVKDSGAAAIENLMRKQGAFDYIMLETTGLADPGPIAAMFWQNEDFSEDIALDGVVCVVDGVFGLKELTSENRLASRRQIALADVLLVNKMDLASSNGGDIQELEQQIRALNPTAPLIQTTHGRVDLSKVLNTGAYNSFKAGNDQKLDVHAHAEDHTHDGDDCHQHDIESISSVQVAIPALSETQLAKLDEWIRLVLWEKLIPDVEVLRCKGIYHTENGKSYILQGVQTLYDVTELPESDSDIGSGKGKVVLIGRGLSKNITNNLQEYLGVL
ncbi:Cobalamin synthesis protein cobW C-terminal domain, partial [Rhizoctonia solani]